MATGGRQVALLFSDIEGSTRLFTRLEDRYPPLQSQHRSLMRAAVARNGGHEVVTEGDSFFVVFDQPSEAIQAALDAQIALASHAWPADAPIHVRMGVHVGEVAEHDGDFVGLAIHHAKRVADAAHGGQVLVTDSVVALAQLPHGATARDLGRHRFKDIDEATRVFQLAHAALRRDFPPIRSLDGEASNLPTPLTDFIGRGDEIEELAALLRTARLVTLTGAGGVGKTRLGCRLASEVADTFHDGVRFVDLAAVDSSEGVAAALATALGLGESPQVSVQQQLVDYLRSRELLLIIDNCEHLVHASSALASRLLSDCARLTILATSREPLGITGEVTWRVPPLAEGRDLFVERARSADPSFHPEGREPVVDQICERLDGIPLAIELAAAKVRVLTCDQIAARLDDAFRLLVGGNRAALERQQTLRATVNWSYQLLDDDAQVLLAAALRLLRRLQPRCRRAGLRSGTARPGARPRLARRPGGQVLDQRRRRALSPARDDPAVRPREAR